eukprot:scaffold26459_cov162-Cylindrotheca_fusiformis.AAC.5
MMQEENETTKKEEQHPLLSDDLEEQHHAGGGEKGNSGRGGEEMTVELLKLKVLAMAAYLRQELSTMDADKAKRLTLGAKEKAMAIALALKALMLQYYDEMTKLDKEKAKELGLKYKAKAEETAGKYKSKAVGVAKELRTMNKAEAKERSLKLIHHAKTGYGSMSTISKLKYGFLVLLMYIVSRSSAPGVNYGKLRHHKHLCYIHDEKNNGKEKVKECESMLAPETKNLNRWIFLGNEPMFALFQPFRELMEEKEGKEKLFNKVKGDRKMRRKVRFYYKYESANQAEWEAKYLNQDPPTEIAGEWASSDCKTCPMMMLNSTKKDLILENLVLETSRDVHLPSDTTETSQETVLRYLKETHDPKKTACVLQQSTYEMTKAPWRTTEEYLRFTDDLHRELENQCSILIRIGLFHTTGALKKKIEEWDQGTRDILLDKGKNAYFIDISNVAHPSQESYVEPVFGMFTRLMGGLQ